LCRNFRILSIQLKDITFKLYLDRSQIAESISKVATSINEAYADKHPILVGVLNGAFMFCSDLAKELTCRPEIHFVKVASYAGTESTGQVNSIFGLTVDLANRHVILIEDIVDTGLTIETLKTEILSYKPASLEVAAFLFKPAAFKGVSKPRYIGMEIPDAFVVGYGLDYDQLGRELPEIYVLDNH
jgi:hypoxanthine phosphoribosyltransferase